MRQQQLYLAGAVLLVVAQMAVIVALLIQRAGRERAERARRESEERFRLAADSAPVPVQRYAAATAAGGVGVWDWNFETNEIYVDPNLESILGFKDGEINSRPGEWASRVHPLDLPIVTARVQECIDGRVPDYEVEHRMVHKDGSARWFLSRGTLMRRANGSPHRMVGTKVDITARKVAEDAIRENQAILQATNQELQNLAGRLIASQEVERGRIARDLHDDISQQVAGLSIALSGLKRRLAVPGAADLEAQVSAIQQRTIALAEEIRHVSHELHPSVLQHAGLVAALTAHCAELEHGQLIVAFTADGDFDATSRDVALCLYRVAQEALRNVVSHSGARRADIGLRRHGNLAELTITDDGVGFDINQVRTSLKGLGLISINERVRLAGGAVSIVTELKKGTRVRVQVPACECAPGSAPVDPTTVAISDLAPTSRTSLSL